jgi:hypothetical protein
MGKIISFLWGYGEKGVVYLYRGWGVTLPYKGGWVGIDKKGGGGG